MSDELSAFDVIRTPAQSTPVDRMRDLLLAERAVVEAAESWQDAQDNALDDDAEFQSLYGAVSKLRELRGK